MPWREARAWLQTPSFANISSSPSCPERSPQPARFADGETEAGGGSGACFRWKRLDQNSGLLTPAFAVPSFRRGKSLVQSIGVDCVSGSELAILNVPSSRLTPRPPREAVVLIPISWRTKVRLRGENSQDLNSGPPAFKARAINWCMLKTMTF